MTKAKKTGGHWTDVASFLWGTIREKDLGYLVAQMDDDLKNKAAVAMFLQWSPVAGKPVSDSWGNAGSAKMRVVGLATTKKPLEQMIAIDEYGAVQLIGSGDKHEEIISKEIQNRGPLRGIRRIDNEVYVVGMNNQAYVRDTKGQWHELMNGFPQTDKTTGLEAIDGFSKTDIYAVGWGGAIWHWNGKTWSATSPLTKHVLTSVCCGANGKIYAAGRAGTIIVGEKNDFKLVQSDENGKDDIWDLAWFNDKLYVSTLHGVFIYDEKNNQLTPVDFRADTPKTFYSLEADEGVLWSIGPKDVMIFDGTTWNRID